MAVSAACLGLPSRFVTRLPDNDLGRACAMSVAQYGVDASHILWGGDRLGIYFHEFGAVQRGSKVIYDRAGSALASIEPGHGELGKMSSTERPGFISPASPRPSARARPRSAWKGPGRPGIWA